MKRENIQRAIKIERTLGHIEDMQNGDFRGMEYVYAELTPHKKGMLTKLLNVLQNEYEKEINLL